MLRRALLATTLLAAAPVMAWAQATDQGAKDIRAQLRASIVELLGPSAKVPAELPIQVTADGDHYRIGIPLGDGPSAPVLTGNARPAAGGTWAISDIRLPSPAEFTVNFPKRAATDGAQAAGMSGPVTYKITVAQQDGTVQLDPTFATPTTSTSMLQGMDLVATGANLHQVSHIDKGSGNAVLTPKDNDRLDVVSNGTIDGYSVTSDATGSQPAVTVSIAHLTSDMHLTNLSRTKLVDLVQMAVRAGASANAAAVAGVPAPKAPLPAAVIETMAGLASGMTVNQNAEKLVFKVQGVGGSLDAVKVGIASKSEGGLLQGGLDIGLVGFALDDIGLGTAAGLIPTKLALHPTISGVPTDALMKLLQAGSDGSNPTDDQIAALFAQGGFTAGLDSFSVDIAGSVFDGTAKLVFTSPKAFDGVGQITATNFDALQQRLAADPTTAQAGPALIFLKGIGKSVGNSMVWDIVYKGQRLVVNGQDLSAMLGGAGGGKAQQAQPEPKAPVPPGGGQPPGRRRP